MAAAPSRALRRPRQLYGLPLPSAGRGVAAVVAVAGTGRLHVMIGAFLDRSLSATHDADAVARDVARALSEIDLLAGPR